MNLKINSVKETCLYVKNLDQAKEFYHNILGFEVISFDEGRHVFFRAGSSVLLCFNPDLTKHEENLPPHYAEGKMHIAFDVEKDQYEQWKSLLIGKGVKITHVEPWGKKYESFYFEDPDGNVLEIVQNGMWPGD